MIARWPRRTRARTLGYAAVVLGLLIVAAATTTYLTYVHNGEYRVEGPLVIQPAGHAGDGHLSVLVGMRGTVTFEGGCARLGASPVLWPADTAWDADKSAAVVDGVVVRSGDEVLSGGFGLSAVEISSARWRESATGRLLGPCIRDPEEGVVLLNRDSDVQIAQSSSAE